MFVKSSIQKPQVKESVDSLGTFPTYRVVIDSEGSGTRVRSKLLSKQECIDSVSMFCDDASIQPEASYVPQPSYDDRFVATEKAVSYAGTLESHFVESINNKN